MTIKINFFHDSFATYLKEYVCNKYKLNFDKIMNDPAYKELHRDKLIKEGNDMRAEKPFIWFDALAAKYADKEIDIVFLISSDFPRQGKDTAASALKYAFGLISTAYSHLKLSRKKSINVLAVADLRYHNEIDGFKIKMAKSFKRVIHIHVTTNLDTLFRRVGTHEALYKMLKLRYDRSERELTINTCDPDYLISNNKDIDIYSRIINEIAFAEFAFFLKQHAANKKLKK